MQTKKAFIREQILRVAKQEFKEKGFQKTSMRDIAKKVNATTGSIYSYFKNKDDLFYTIIKPAILAIENDKNLDDHSNNIFDYDQDKIALMENDIQNMFSHFVKHFKDELFLLHFRSEGSEYEKYIDDYVNIKASQFTRRIEEKQQEGIFKKGEVDPYFLRLPVLLALSIIQELLLNSMTDEDIEDLEKKAIPLYIKAWECVFAIYK
ncbi:MAG: TetR/AcrR family transcriptional regulator [Hyphomicrobiales bacterium]